MKILFFIYAAAIPLVPLWGAGYYKRRGNHIKCGVCFGLFALQALISFGSILSYFAK